MRPIFASPMTIFRARMGAGIPSSEPLHLQQNLLAQLTFHVLLVLLLNNNKNLHVLSN